MDLFQAAGAIGIEDLKVRTEGDDTVQHAALHQGGGKFRLKGPRTEAQRNGCGRGFHGLVG